MPRLLRCRRGRHPQTADRRRRRCHRRCHHRRRPPPATTKRGVQTVARPRVVAPPAPARCRRQVQVSPLATARAATPPAPPLGGRQRAAKQQQKRACHPRCPPRGLVDCRRRSARRGAAAPWLTTGARGGGRCREATVGGKARKDGGRRGGGETRQAAGGVAQRWHQQRRGGGDHRPTEPSPG